MLTFSKSVAITNSLYNTFFRFYNASQTSNDTENELNYVRNESARLLAERSYQRLKNNPSEELKNQIIDSFIIQGAFYDIFEEVFKDDSDMLIRITAAYNQIVSDLIEYKKK